MCKKRLFTAVMFLAAIIFGYGHASAEISNVPADHSHYYPFTQNLADKYHVRLAVDHESGKMMLVFEDVTENEVRLIRVKTIKAEVIFADGKIEETIFRVNKKFPRSTHRDAHPIKQLKKRKAGTFVYRADWIKSTPQFDLKVSFPFKKSVYDFVFNYEGVIEKNEHRRPE